jgi:ANTAR domain
VAFVCPIRRNWRWWQAFLVQTSEPVRSAEDRARIEESKARAEEDRQLIAHLHDEAIVGARLVANLQAALVSPRRIGAAIGILMNSGKITEEAAFDHLVNTSQRENRELRDVCEDVVATGSPDPLS